MLFQFSRLFKSSHGSSTVMKPYHGRGLGSFVGFFFFGGANL